MAPLRFRYLDLATILTLVATILFLSGCRGSRPFERFVRVSQEELVDDLSEVDPPQQRLAGKTQTGSAEKDGSSHRGDDQLDQPRSRGGVTEISLTANESRSNASTAESSAENKVASRTPVQHPRINRPPSSPTKPASKPSAIVVTSLPAPPASAGKTAVDEERELIKALADYPPEVRREALRRLLASSASRAKRTDLPAGYDQSIEQEIKNLDQFPAFDGVSNFGSKSTKPKVAAKSTPGTKSVPRNAVAGPKPGNGSVVNDSNQPKPESAASQVVAESLSKPPMSHVAERDAEKHAHQSTATNRLAVTDSLKEKQPSYEQTEASPLTTAVVESLTDAGPSQKSAVQTVSATATSDSAKPMVAQASSAINNTGASVTDTFDPADFDHAALFAALQEKLSVPGDGESESERSSRLMKLRHLMVLSGDVDSAVEGIDGLSEAEQEFIRHQLLGLWTMVDPKGHPIAARRITTALPQLREATKFAAAATDSLEVRALAFCTEIEAYGQIKPFAKNRFQAGQQVILYCEVENFTAKSMDNGFETHLQGTFDVYNTNNEKVVSQLLPADRQVSNNYLRDYFIAYQMHLPKQLAPGAYRLRLTMEDVSGKKYGQSNIDFEIAR